ncbi:hypothetical protein KC361_g162 [Hortaea werneckii]|nr:hypothetical protein KC361_g162 [Hortaea werneckii]
MANQPPPGTVAVSRRAGTRAQDEEVVAVEVDGVRDGRGAAVLLDQPVVPLALVGGIVDVHAGLVVVVVLGEVLQRRLLPVDVHGRVAEGPDEERVTAGRELGLRDADVEAALGVVESAGGNGLDPVWCGLAWLLAVARLRVTAGGRLARRSVAIAPDGFGVEVVCAKAVGRHVRTEPVVARGLVGLDDNVVTLTNTDENRLRYFLPFCIVTLLYCPPPLAFLFVPLMRMVSPGGGGPCDWRLIAAKELIWSRVLVVDEKAQAFSIAVWVASAVRNVKIICDRVSGGGELLVEVGSYTVAVTPAKPRVWTMPATAIGDLPLLNLYRFSRNRCGSNE